MQTQDWKNLTIRQKVLIFNVVLVDFHSETYEVVVVAFLNNSLTDFQTLTTWLQFRIQSSALTQNAEQMKKLLKILQVLLQVVIIWPNNFREMKRVQNWFENNSFSSTKSDFDFQKPWSALKHLTSTQSHHELNKIS